jgi:AraC-type DNA-binding domain-containing proteins
MYRSDEEYYTNNPSKRVYAVTIQFAQTFFNFSMKSYPEFHHIKHLLEQAKGGIKFHIETESRLGTKIINLVKLKGLERLLSSIEILHLLSQMENRKELNLEPTLYSNLIFSDARLSRVLQKINKEYRNPITLEEIARYAGMHESAFCRYFKQKTSRTFNQYISELRIGYACRLMLENRLTIAQICYECGFNNISNFNRSFKKLKEITPTEYIEKYQVMNAQNKEFENKPDLYVNYMRENNKKRDSFAINIA